MTADNASASLLFKVMRVAALLFLCAVVSGCVNSGDERTSALSSAAAESKARETRFREQQKAAVDKQKALFEEQRQLALKRMESASLANSRPGSLTEKPRSKTVTPRSKKASVTANSRGSRITYNAPWKCVPNGLKAVIYEVSRKFGPVTINSTHRSKRHNRRIGGARKSYHLRCAAVDFRVKGNSRAVLRYLRRHPNVGGVKRYRSGFFHIDNGPKRSWS